MLHTHLRTHPPTLSTVLCVCVRVCEVAELCLQEETPAAAAVFAGGNYPASDASATADSMSTLQAARHIDFLL